MLTRASFHSAYSQSASGKGRERLPLDLLEQLTTADAEFAHRPAVHRLHGERDGGVAFGEREEGLPPQAPENVALREPHSCLDLRLVARLSRPRRQHADAVMRRERAIGAIDLGVVERRLVDPALQIVGNQQPRRAAEKAEHAHMRAGPVRQLLRPGRLGIGEVRGAEHGDENLRLADLARGGVHDADALAGIVDEDLVAGRHGAAASPASVVARSRGADRKNGCSHSPPDAPPGIPPTRSSC